MASMQFINVLNADEITVQEHDICPEYGYKVTKDGIDYFVCETEYDGGYGELIGTLPHKIIKGNHIIDEEKFIRFIGHLESSPDIRVKYKKVDGSPGSFTDWDEIIISEKQ